MPIETTGSRTRLNLVDAVDLKNIAATHVSRYKKSEKTIHLILDGAGYHRAQVVKNKAVEL
ncbi:MAG: hypothetical protein HRT51_00125 [Colwellia sp.]|nr:hypothetical protein [Colwellia sp.]NQY86147.1 hypothetical protein [Colwellia sp.]